MPHILLVDDEPLISMLVQDWLTELQCETVGPASSVRGALDLINRIPVDGAILDVSLRNEDCFPVADVLLERGVPFAFATGHSALSLAPRFSSALILSKPFTFEDVSEIVEKLSGKRNTVPAA